MKNINNLMVHEILKDISMKKTQEEAVETLKFYNEKLSPKKSMALRTILKGTLDDLITWRLPPTAKPPYTPASEHSAPSDLFKYWEKILFFAEGSPKCVENKQKRESIYLQFLEGIHPKDASVIVDMVRKKSSYKHITRTVVELAFGESFFEKRLVPKKAA